MDGVDVVERDAGTKPGLDVVAPREGCTGNSRKSVTGLKRWSLAFCAAVRDVLAPTAETPIEIRRMLESHKDLARKSGLLRYMYCCN
ncbi:hypothetical protein ACLB2K_047109 [Fragaria x ananassa]